VTSGAARGATLLQRLDGYSPSAWALSYHTLPRLAEECAAERASAAAAVAACSQASFVVAAVRAAPDGSAAPRVSSLEAPRGAAAASATAAFAAAVLAAQGEAEASQRLPREYAARLRVIPSFRNKCVLEWHATLVPPPRGAGAGANGDDQDGGAEAEEAAREAARAELEAFAGAAADMMLMRQLP
jgi:hypothetical protein